MKPDQYGEKYQEHLFEQYRLYVEMADRISQRREQANRFYLTLVSAVIALLILLTRAGAPEGIWAVIFLISGIFGAVLSGIWIFNIRSYQQVNTAKFTIINDIERQLPYAGYTAEWEWLRPQSGPQRYFQLTRVEQLVPAVILLLFIGIAIYAVFLLV